MTDQAIIGRGVQTLQVAGVPIKIPASATRTQFVITNLESPGATTRIIYVASSDGNAALAVFPFTALTLETNAEIWVYAGSSNSVQCLICEVFGGWVAHSGSPAR
jgi:hypothetical protein